ncbi:MAG: hypothetical protein AAB393_19810, partial [Bacteroidota bacterium]
KNVQLTSYVSSSPGNMTPAMFADRDASKDGNAWLTAALATSNTRRSRLDVFIEKENVKNGSVSVHERGVIPSRLDVGMFGI